MIVSHNEIVTLVQKAFWGMRRESGEADLIANMVAELQMAGLEGIRHFNNASDHLLLESDRPIEVINDEIIDNVVLDDSADNLGFKNNAPVVIKFDLHSNSIACHLPAVLDYALERMADYDHMVLELRHCHNRWLAYGELVKLASKGIACTARWNNGSDPKHTLFILNLGRIYPELFFFADNPTTTYQAHDMIIELATSDFDLASHSAGFSHHISGEQIIERHQRAWSSGIEVEEGQWQKLKQTAANILVENSETSMHGAGGI